MKTEDLYLDLYRPALDNLPIINSLLDTDFYKLLMLQMIWYCYHNVDVTFALINRSKDIKLANIIDEEELRYQLDHARLLKFSEDEISWLAQKGFRSDFLNWLKNYQLPSYELTKSKGQFLLSISGKWINVTLWEIPILSIINELKSRVALKKMKAYEIEKTYFKAKEKLYSKIKILQKFPTLKIADFGTRRRHSFAWQNWCIHVMKEKLKENFIGTSNIFYARKLNSPPIGTNGHELPMTLTALSSNKTEMQNAPYKILENWAQFYKDNLLILLPDTFGSQFFFQNAPKWVALWKGARIDSADPIKSGERIISWWRQENQDPLQKILIFSDSLDVEQISKIYTHFHKKTNLSFGWGTNLTNDFQQCFSHHDHDLQPTSLVCKVVSANGKSVVKLSDDFAKATGEIEDIKRYIEIFQN